MEASHRPSEGMATMQRGCILRCGRGVGAVDAIARIGSRSSSRSSRPKDSSRSSIVTTRFGPMIGDIASRASTRTSLRRVDVMAEFLAHSDAVLFAASTHSASTVVPSGVFVINAMRSGAGSCATAALNGLSTAGAQYGSPCSPPVGRIKQRGTVVDGSRHRMLYRHSTRCLTRERRDRRTCVCGLPGPEKHHNMMKGFGWNRHRR